MQRVTPRSGHTDRRTPSGSSPTPLSVLDLTVVGGTGPVLALFRTTTPAQAAERWDHGRFRVAEHHSFRATGSTAPTALLAHLAGAISTIRLGSGGVMLTNHAPLVVAEQFGVLDASHPGRVDLGDGRNPGGLPAVARALRRAGDDGSEGFAALLEELRGFCRDGPLTTTPITAITCTWCRGRPGFPYGRSGPARRVPGRPRVWGCPSPPPSISTPPRPCGRSTCTGTRSAFRHTVGAVRHGVRERHLRPVRTGGPAPGPAGGADA